MSGFLAWISSVIVEYYMLITIKLFSIGFIFP